MTSTEKTNSVPETQQAASLESVHKMEALEQRVMEEKVRMAKIETQLQEMRSRKEDAIKIADLETQLSQLS